MCQKITKIMTFINETIIIHLLILFQSMILILNYQITERMWLNLSSAVTDVNRLS